MTPRKTPRWPWALALALTATGCGHKSEQQQLDDLREGLAYRGYRHFSEHGLPLAHAALVRSATLAHEPPPPAWPEMACGTHMGLSYLALSGNKLTPAIVEADLLERDCNGAVIANALRAVAFKRLQ